MKTREILSIITLSLLGLGLLLAIGSSQVKKNPTRKKNLNKASGGAIFLAVILLGVNQLIKKEQKKVTVLPPGSRGGPCETGNICHPGLSCNSKTQICELAIPSNIEPHTRGGSCTSPGTGGEGLHCNKGLVCNRATNKCVPLIPGTIEPHTRGGSCVSPMGVFCNKGLVCNTATNKCTPIHFVPPGSRGGVCRTDDVSPCGSGRPGDWKLRCNNETHICDVIPGDNGDRCLSPEQVPGSGLRGSCKADLKCEGEVSGSPVLRCQK